jgi:hypothetical protein
MIKKSLLRISRPIKGLELVEGTKFLGRIITKDSKTFFLCKGDRVVLIRRKRIVPPK